MMNAIAALNRKQELAAKVTTDDTFAISSYVQTLMFDDMETGYSFATFTVGETVHIIGSEDLTFFVDGVADLTWYEAELYILELVAVDYINFQFAQIVEQINAGMVA